MAAKVKARACNDVFFCLCVGEDVVCSCVDKTFLFRQCAPALWLVVGTCSTSSVMLRGRG
jgi:hypothetical protein